MLYLLMCKGIAVLIDDESFDDYTTTTIDPGDTLIIIAVFICLGSLLSLPLFAKLGKWLESRNQSSSNCSEDCKEEDNAIVEYTEDTQTQVTSPNTRSSNDSVAHFSQLSDGDQ